MSFSDLVSGGAECGPSNPLSSFSKRFGQDRGAQLDRFGSGAEASGSSRPAPSFRSQHGLKPASSSEQAFFQHQHPNHHAGFDMAPLKGALPFSPSIGPLDPGLEHSWKHVNQREDFENSFRHTPPPPPTMTAGPGWARDYSPQAQQQQAQQQQEQHHYPLQQQSSLAQDAMHHRPRIGMQGMARLNPMGMRMGPSDVRNETSVQQSGQAYNQEEQSVDSSKWDSAFTAYERPSSPARQLEGPIGQAHQEGMERAETNSHEADELAKTAGRLVSTVEHETNSKFKQSNFLNLMRKIRDKQAGIQGSDIVETSVEEQQQQGAATAISSAPSTLDKGKGREQVGGGEARARMGMKPSSANGPMQMAPGPETYDSEMQGREMLNDMWAEEDARSEAIERQAMERAFLGDGGNVAQRRKEDADEFARYQQIMSPDFGSAADVIGRTGMEEDFDQESSEDFVGRRWEGTRGRGVSAGQGAEWDTLQKDWEAWQAAPAGMTANMQPPASAASAPLYRFHAMNPYVGANRLSNHGAQHAASLPADMQSVLEREAAVQQDPTNATAWFDLGVKQQENEREGLAIAALQRAIQLDPTLRDAWLALAVSYTNENDRMAAFEAIERWIGATPAYSAVVRQHQSEIGSDGASKASQGYSERHERLSNLLIALARHGSLQNQIDADVQVALGVLFNSSEDYDKAVDCFTAALSVRPEDWLLYNRLGATLSNSGRSEEALRYYHQALDLRPGFVRCHFNLSISCLNLKLYQDAASHIYTALTLQSESAEGGGDEPQGSGGGGVTSSSLWETLRVSCELMDRPDLANLTTDRDLSKLDPSDFWTGSIDEEMV